MAGITNGSVLTLALKRLQFINIFNGMDIKVVAKANHRNFSVNHEMLSIENSN